MTRHLPVSRIITVQAERFPELEHLAHEEGWVAAVKGVARVLAHYAERKEISIGDPELAADMFLSLVLGRVGHYATRGRERPWRGASWRPCASSSKASV